MVADLPDFLPPHVLTRIATIFFETGLIHTLSIIASLGVYLKGSNLEYVASLSVSLSELHADIDSHCSWYAFPDDPHNRK